MRIYYKFSTEMVNEYGFEPMGVIDVEKRRFGPSDGPYNIPKNIFYFASSIFYFSDDSTIYIKERSENHYQYTSEERLMMVLKY